MQADKKQRILMLALPLAVALLLWLGSSLAWGWLDVAVSQRIAVAAGLRQLGGGGGVIVWLVDISLLLATCLLAFLAGNRLGSNGRIVVFIQLFALMVLCQCLLFVFTGQPGMPFTTVLGLTACGALGFWRKRLEWRDEQEQARYFQLLIKNKELQEARLLLIKQDEIERRTLASDLHDQVLNDLKAVRQQFDDIKEGLEPQTRQRVEALLSHSMAAVREVMDNLFPSALEHLGLVAAMEDCIRRGAESGGYKPRFKSNVSMEQLQSLSLIEQTLLYRLVQESVTNICKHARATTVRGTVELDDKSLTLGIADDGAGMSSAALRADSRGLRYMRQRADLIGATISWRVPEDGRGTLVEVRLELNGAESGTHPDH